MRRVIVSLMVGLLVLLGSAGSAEGVATLFTDDFSGYVDGQINQAGSPWVAPWIDADNRVHVGPAEGDMARLDIAPMVAADPLRTAWVPGANTLGGVLQSDYIVRGSWWVDHPIGVYVAGRVVSADTFITAAAMIHEGTVYRWGEQWVDGTRNVFTGWTPLTAWVPDEPIHLALILEGDTATAVASHAGVTGIGTGTALITAAGSPGFAGRNLWGNPEARFDNFVVTEIPEPATMILLGLGLGFVGLKGLRKKRA